MMNRLHRARRGDGGPAADPAGFEILCLALQPQESSDPARLGHLIAQPRDYRALRRAARKHRILERSRPALIAAGLPREAAQDWQAAADRNARRALAQARELARLATQFAVAGIPLFALKGVTLSLALFETMARRDVGDIDLLIEPDDWPAADRILGGLGYRRTTWPDLNLRDPAWPWIKDIAYRHDEAGHVLDMHLRLFENPARLPVSAHALWPRRETVLIAGQDVAVLPFDIAPLYLALHGACHFWERLGWIDDLAQVLSPPEQMRGAFENAAPLGLTGAIGLGLALADRLLHRRWPATAPIETTTAMQEADRFIEDHFSGQGWLRFEDYDRPSDLGTFLRRRRHFYRLRPGWCALWSEIRADLWNPVDRPWVTPPPGMDWLYPLLRPLGRWRRATQPPEAGTRL